MTSSWSRNEYPFSLDGVMIAAQSPQFWSDTQGTAEYLSTATAAADGFADITPKTSEVMDAYQAEYDSRPTTPTFVGFITHDAVNLYAEAVERAGTANHREDIDSIVEELQATDFEGSYGRIQFQGPDDEYPNDVYPGEGPGDEFAPFTITSGRRRKMATVSVIRTVRNAVSGPRRTRTVIIKRRPGCNVNWYDIRHHHDTHRRGDDQCDLRADRNRIHDDLRRRWGTQSNPRRVAHDRRLRILRHPAVSRPSRGVLVGIVLAALASYGVYMGLVRYIEENVVITFIATIMAALALQEAMTMAFSQQAQVLTPIVPGSIAIAGTRMQYDQLLAFVFSWVMIGMLWYYVTNTKDGRAILATSMSERGAIFTGVDLPRVRRQTWLIAGAFAGVGGLFIGRLQQTSPEMWLEPLTLAFMIVIIGGVGSIKGSIIAAYLIGYIETLTVALLGAPYRVVVALLIIIAVIMYRPEGLYGREYLE